MQRRFRVETFNFKSHCLRAFGVPGGSGGLYDLLDADFGQQNERLQFTACAIHCALARAGVDFDFAVIVKFGDYAVFVHRGV